MVLLHQSLKTEVQKEIIGPDYVAKLVKTQKIQGQAKQPN